MKTRSLRLSLLLAALALWIMACTGGDDPRPCTPLDGATRDPCEGSLAGLAQQTVGNVRGDSLHVGDAPLPVRFFLDGAWSTEGEAHLVVRGQFVPQTIRCITQTGNRSPPYLSDANWDLPRAQVLCGTAGRQLHRR